LTDGEASSGSCHLFRHTAATLMLEGGSDIRYIQALRGHAELSRTQIDTQVSIRKLQEVHRATHPGPRLTSAAIEASREDEASGAEAREAMLPLLAAESEEESGE
jgi:integrase/recombinase XerD